MERGSYPLPSELRRAVLDGYENELRYHHVNADGKFGSCFQGFILGSPGHGCFGLRSCRGYRLAPIHSFITATLSTD